MKRVIIFCTIFLVGCSSWKDSDWDSGGAKQNSYQVERMEEHTENVNDQFPSAGPSSEVNLP